MGIRRDSKDVRQGGDFRSRKGQGRGEGGNSEGAGSQPWTRNKLRGGIQGLSTVMAS